MIKVTLWDDKIYRSNVIFFIINLVIMFFIGFAYLSLNEIKDTKIWLIYTFILFGFAIIESIIVIGTAILRELKKLSKLIEGDKK